MVFCKNKSAFEKRDIENLKSNVIIVLIAEIVVGLVLAFTHSNDFSLPLFLFACAINLAATTLLLIHKPKDYFYPIALLLATILITVFFSFYELSTIQC